MSARLPLSLALWMAAALAGVTAACAPTVSNPPEYGERPISAEAGKEYFLHTGGGDPYATGMAYPVFLALMELYPNDLGRDWNEMCAKFGFIPDPEGKGSPRASTASMKSSPELGVSRGASI